ncbi:MAG: rhomboid family intramembrane serine protease [Candidatus Peribacteria bacterium]|nr:MAG: rhomboid family intramembrane serine protease [Candidatus Peribacteria bacterium]
MYGSISNILIFISLVFTIGAYIFPNLYVLGMNSYFLDNGAYHIYLLQFFSSNFIHGGILHLLFNSVFIYYFGNTLELLIGRAKFLLFFVFVVIFNGITLTYLSSGNTVGISGFAMALLAYYTLELRSKNNPEYK